MVSIVCLYLWRSFVTTELVPLYLSTLHSRIQRYRIEESARTLVVLVVLIVLTGTITGDPS